MAESGAGRPITVAPRGYTPTVLAISPGGKTAWVVSVNYNSRPAAGLLTPISISTNHAGKPIRVGPKPVCLLVTAGHPTRRPPQGSCSFVFRSAPLIAEARPFMRHGAGAK
jgi:hypothetical protein